MWHHFIAPFVRDSSRLGRRVRGKLWPENAMHDNYFSHLRVERIHWYWYSFYFSFIFFYPRSHLLAFNFAARGFILSLQWPSFLVLCSVIRIYSTYSYTVSENSSYWTRNFADVPRAAVPAFIQLHTHTTSPEAAQRSFFLLLPSLVSKVEKKGGAGVQKNFAREHQTNTYTKDVLPFSSFFMFIWSWYGGLAYVIDTHKNIIYTYIRVSRSRI